MSSLPTICTLFSCWIICYAFKMIFNIDGAWFYSAPQCRHNLVFFFLNCMLLGWNILYWNILCYGILCCIDLESHMICYCSWNLYNSTIVDILAEFTVYHIVVVDRKLIVASGCCTFLNYLFLAKMDVDLFLLCWVALLSLV